MTFVKLQILILVLVGCAKYDQSQWQRITVPFKGPAASIGSYTNGCLAGAVSLYPQGKGYQVMRLSRGRFYGHPTLIEYVNQLAAKVNGQGLPQLLIGDLSAARGGPLAPLHVSHQIGLDVDIWYHTPEVARAGSLSLGKRETLQPLKMTKGESLVLNKFYWDDDILKVLKLAAEDDKVLRILTTPGIKKRLCESEQYGKQSWIWKIRPWWGHRDHFHVRLHCPEDSPNCKRQSPPGTNGCDETLDWWYSPEARNMEMKKSYRKDNWFEMPEACYKLRSDDKQI